MDLKTKEKFLSEDREVWEAEWKPRPHSSFRYVVSANKQIYLYVKTSLLVSKPQDRNKTVEVKSKFNKKFAYT
jgi:hypothetical protein